MSRYSQTRLDRADVDPGLIIAGARVGWIRSSGAPRHDRARIRRKAGRQGTDR